MLLEARRTPSSPPPLHHDRQPDVNGAHRRNRSAESARRSEVARAAAAHDLEHEGHRLAGVRARAALSTCAALRMGSAITGPRLRSRRSMPMRRDRRKDVLEEDDGLTAHQIDRLQRNRDGPLYVATHLHEGDALAQGAVLRADSARPGASATPAGGRRALRDNVRRKRSSRVSWAIFGCGSSFLVARA